MAAIRTLLNPAPETIMETSSDGWFGQKTKPVIRDCSPSPQLRKKQKIVKDAPVYNRGPPQGECRYPPDEFQDDMLRAQHQQLELFPIGEIAQYPRHIPYNSKKKEFLGKTGRESLEVFQYQFKKPGSDNTYSILWDYNVGLVRTTPLFKCTGHAKTTPGKVLNRNPGLRDICHSITGGSLVAQGYWMPYEAAKAVAATFCWPIRYALTPVFGVDFPSICVNPESEKYCDMTIDPAIIKRCTEQCRNYRETEALTASSPSTILSPLTPDTPSYSNHGHLIRPCKPHLSEFYGSDSGVDDQKAISPNSTYRNVWTPANTPRSVLRPSTPHTHYNLQPPPFSPNSQRSSPALSPKSHRHHGIGSRRSSRSKAGEDRNSRARLSDERAAYLLMNLKLQGASRKTESKRRRASI